MDGYYLEVKNKDESIAFQDVCRELGYDWFLTTNKNVEDNYYIVPNYPCVMFMQSKNMSLRWCSVEFWNSSSLKPYYTSTQECKEYMRKLRKLKLWRVKEC